jgi:histidine ammonia-lyase
MLLALRIHELSLAHSLISEETFKKLIDAFNNDILAYVPE